MAERWTLAFVIAAWLAVGGNALLRRRARAAGGTSDAWATQLRQLGGVVVAGAALAGWLAAPRYPRAFGITAAAAAGVAVLGVLDERRALPGLVRIGAYTAAAGAVVAAGVRAELLGSSTLDVLLTIGWIVVVTNAFRRLDHADGLVPTVGALTAAGLFAVAGAADPVSSTACVAVAGACAGMLVFNLRPASTVMGPSGSAFVGFALAVMVVAFTPNVSTPGHLLVPVLMFALPILDVFVVTVSRLWRGVPLGRSRRDHLVHRLRGRGWSRSWAIAALLGAQALLVGCGVLVGRGTLSPAVALLVASALGAALLARRGGAPTRLQAAARTRGRRVIEVVVGTLGVLAALNLLAAWQGYRNVQSAQAALSRALADGHRGDTRAAETAFMSAARSFRGAEAWLDSPLGWLGRSVPVLAENLRAARELSHGGRDLATAGVHLANASNTRLQVADGTVRVDEVRRLTPDVVSADRLVEHVLGVIERLRRPFLIGPVRDRVDHAASQLQTTAREGRFAVAAAKIAPAVFGADQPRNYFLAVQNPAELRATGGIIGNWGIVTASKGKVDIGDVQRIRVLNDAVASARGKEPRLNAPQDYLDRYSRFTPMQIWQNLNMSPDLPTVGHVIASLYPQLGGTPVDGVIAVDPIGLQALLQLTGPVSVQNWPAPISADNVVDVTLRQEYDAFTDLPTREEFLGDVARTVWKKATSSSLGNPARLARVLGTVGRQGHLSLWFANAEEEALATELGIGGELVPPGVSDSMLVTSQNAAGNKVDYYAKRHTEYSVQVTPDPGERRASALGQLRFTFDNAAPGGRASYSLGPFDGRFSPGEDVSFVSVYTPLEFSHPTIDGRPGPLEPGRELGRNVFSTYLSVPAGGSSSLSLRLDGDITLGPGGWYRLDLPRQPAVGADDVTVTVTTPRGWRIAEAAGLDVVTPHRATARISQVEREDVRVRLARE
jgi:UDP-N-acetylmuramyl pentapeptide phosphotransferase/UDP-N-acetylglucosamine-1-phosphate transferase